MTKRKKTKFWRRYGFGLCGGGLVALGLVGGMAAYFFYQGHFLPRTVLVPQRASTAFNQAQTDLSNLDLEQARARANQQMQVPLNLEVVLRAQNVSVASASSTLKLRYDLDKTLEQALAAQREVPFYQLLAQLLTPGKKSLAPVLTYDSQALDDFVAGLAAQVNQTGLPASLAVDAKTKKPVIQAGQNEIVLDEVATEKLLLAGLPQQVTFEAVMREKELALSEAQVASLSAQAEELMGKEIILTTEELDNYEYTLSPSELIPLLGPESASKAAVIADFMAEIEVQVTRLPQEPELIVNAEKTKVEKFTPPLEGLSLQKELLIKTLENSVASLAQAEEEAFTLELPLTVTQSKTALADTNALGIKEQIGFGESYYAHSIAGRIHNVALTAERIDNTLVAPGAEFSFNQTLGEVSGATGFQPGYVIQGGRSVLSDGGGVCQVSTTLFRALLDAGVQITRRLPHSYRVSYYELDNDPGFDATVYAGNVDLRFVNDTGNYLLVSSETDSKNLYMTVRIYGTSDGRRSEITNYKKFNASAAPPTEYIPDPSLAPGERKQIDWAVGGLQTNFTHTIYNADGSVRSQKDYPSTYHAWSSKFLVGPE